jgi:hypothetical protein
MTNENGYCELNGKSDKEYQGSIWPKLMIEPIEGYQKNDQIKRLQAMIMKSRKSHRLGIEKFSAAWQSSQVVRGSF